MTGQSFSTVEWSAGGGLGLALLWCGCRLYRRTCGGSLPRAGGSAKYQLVGQQADSDAEEPEETTTLAERDDLESAAGVNTSIDSVASSYSRFKEAREVALISGSRSGDIVVPEARPQQAASVLPDATATEAPLGTQGGSLEAMDDVDFDSFMSDRDTSHSAI
eukprot:COSAG01_NODE_3059_length_6658_cov_3.106178_5_plen_163_part_00